MNIGGDDFDGDINEVLAANKGQPAQATQEVPAEDQETPTEAAPEVQAEPETKVEGDGKKAKKAKKAKKEKNVQTTKKAGKVKSSKPAEVPAEEAAPDLEEAQEAAAYQSTAKLSKAQTAYLEEARAAWAEAKKSAKKGALPTIDPRYLVIVGLDVPDDENDPLHDPERVAVPLQEGWIKSMIVAGLRGSAISVIERDGAAYVHNGRQRVKNVREANNRLAKAGEPINLAEVMPLAGLSDDDQALMGSLLNYTIEETPMQKARKAARLFARTKSKEQVAIAMGGISTQQVTNYLQAVEAPVDLQKAVDKGALTFTAMTPILRLPTKGEQVQALNDILESGDTSVKGVTAYVRSLLGEGGDDDEGEEGEGGGSRKRNKNKGAEEGWEKGRAPKKRFVNKVIDRILENTDEDTEEGQAVNTIVRAIRWVIDGEAPPKLLAGHVRAVSNALAKAKEE